MNSVWRITWFSAFCVYSCALARAVGAQDPTSSRETRTLLIWASVENLVIGFDARHPAGGDYLHEVYQDTLEEFPIIVLVNFSASIDGADIPLRSGSDDWVRHVRLKAEKDGQSLDEFQLEPLPSLEFALAVEDRGGSEWKSTRRMPVALHAGQSFTAFCRIVESQGSKLPVGTYDMTVDFAEGAAEFFGLPVGGTRNFGVRVKARTSGDEDRYVEDLIHRHYAWGVWLYKFDKTASKKEFEDAWKLLTNYLERGAGDEPNAWNITPRFQALMLSGWLDRPEDELRYLGQVLDHDSDAKIEGRQCKMRFYYFGSERGQLPRNLRDDLVLKRYRFYETLYGQRMNGQTVQPLRPWPRKFADSPDPTLKIDEWLPKKPE